MQDDVALGKRVVESKLATAEQVRECFAMLQDLKKKGGVTVPRLAQILVSKGYVTEREIGLLVPTGGPKAEPDLELLEDPAAATGQGRSGPTIIPSVDELMIVPAPAPVRAKAPAGPPPQKLKSPPKRAVGAEPTPVAARRGGFEAPMIQCPFCGLEIREGIARQTCPHCGDLYHEDCWDRSSGCVKETCRNQKEAADGAPRVLAATEYSLYTELRPILMKVGAAIVLVVVGVLGWLHFAHDAQYYYELGKAAGPKSAAGGGERAWNPADLHRATLAIEETGGAISTIEKTVALEEQIRNFRIATEKKPDFAEAWFALGASYFELKKFKETVNALNKVLAIRPADQQAVLFLGNASEQLGDFPEAERWYRKALEAKPDLTEAHELLAYMLENKCQGRETDAAKEFELILVARPDDPVIAGELAHIWIGQKMYDQAVALLEKVSQRTPDSPQINQKRAELYLAQGKWAKALEFSEPLAAAETQGCDARRIQAVALWKLGRDSEAYVVGKVVCAAGFDDDVYRLTGALAMRFGEADLGIGYLRTAIQNSRRPETLELVGDAMLALGRPDEAKTAYEELRSVNSTWPRVGFKVGLAAAALPDRARAASALKELRARAAADPDLNALELRLQRESGDATGALSGLNALVTESPKSYYAHFQLALALRDGGKSAAALNELRIAYSIVPDPEVRYEMGLIYGALKKEGAARDMMKQYIDSVPYGLNHDKAVAVVSTGGAEAQTDQFTPTLKLCADLIPKLTTQSAPNPYHWMHVTAALRGIATVVDVLGGDSEKAGVAAGWFNMSVGSLQSTDTFKRPDITESALNREVEAWNAVWPDAIEMMAAVVRKRDPDKKYADALERIREDLRQRMEAVGAIDEGIACSARAFTSILNLLVGMLSDSDTTREQIARIETQRRVQDQVCINSMQRFCGEIYAAVKSADLLLGVQDRRKLYEDRKRAVLRRFEQRELGARSVVEQLRNGTGTLAELLEIIVADSSLRP